MDRTIKVLKELLNTVRTLRSPGGCNWDRSQTLRSLRPYMLEEAYEVADAVDNNDMQELKKELGDLLLHIIMAADICSEENIFDLADVAEQITEKLKRRHPHVFDKTNELTPEEVEKQWEAIKAVEKKQQKKRFFDSIPEAMPALQKSWRIQQRASEVGYRGKAVEESIDEISLLTSKEISAEDLGSILFSLADIARQKNIEPERALRERNRSFISRFNHLEELLESRGCSLNEPDGSDLKECIAIAFNNW